MNASSNTAWPAADVAPNADDIITAEVSRRFPPILLDDLWAHPHRLTAEDLAQRISAMQGQSFSQIRAGLQHLVDEVEIHRWGYDLGHEEGFQAGYDRAVNDAVEHPETFMRRLLEIRPGAAQ